jgi:dipeptidyl aminopeptidase/acylaminoacyl peptidase
MKKIILSTLLLGASLLVTTECSKATVDTNTQANSSQTKQENEKIDYSAPPDAPYTAEEVTVTAKGYTLAGTLLLPKSGARPFPAVITITGSGQQTRDEPIPLPGLEKYKPMRQIAEALASRGIAVLRVDDRGVGGSGGRETLQDATTSGFADDVRAEVAYLRTRSEIDPKRIALVGHSEGGIIAPMIAATDPQIAAIVLMAGTAKTGAQISTDQLNDALERMPNMSAEEKEKQRAQQQEIIHAVQTGGDLSKYPAQVRLPWVKEFWTYDPLPTIRKVRQPILIVQGALDRQVTAEQAGMLEKAAREGGNKDVTVQAFPNLNHLFLPAKTGAFSEYSTLEQKTIGDDVLKVLGDWLEGKLKPAAKPAR